MNRTRTSLIWRPEPNEFAYIVKTSISYIEILRRVGYTAKGGNYKVVKQRILEENLDDSHIQNYILIHRDQILKRGQKQTPLEQIFQEQSTYTKGYRLKQFLIKNYNRTEVCSECNVGATWNGKPLSLQVDHINGINDDNRLENLRFLCPNCHSQTDTFAGRKTRKEGRKQRETRSEYIERVKGKPGNARPSSRKVIWPEKEELRKLIWEMPTTHVARKFGVSDNAVAKWVKAYGLTKPPRGYWTQFKTA